MNSSFELLKALKNAGFDATKRDEYWWPDSGTTRVLIGAILTQQTKWERVEKALEELNKYELIDLEKLSKSNMEDISSLIKSCGFYTQKAKRIIDISRSVLDDFGDFESFCNHVDRDWLLSQKGVGPESADAVLCYACKREAMVVDRYTHILLSFYGYEFETYDEIQEWLVAGLQNDQDLLELYGQELPKSQIYARFHGKILDFCKGKIKKGTLQERVPGLYE